MLGDSLNDISGCMICIVHQVGSIVTFAVVLVITVVIPFIVFTAVFLQHHLLISRRHQKDRLATILGMVHFAISTVVSHHRGCPIYSYSVSRSEVKKHGVL